MWGRRVLPATLPAPFSATESGPLGLSVSECRAAGSASGQTACPIRPTLRHSRSPGRQSRSHHNNSSPLSPCCPSLPLLPVWMNVYFLSPWCRTSLLFDFLSVLVVRGGGVSTYAAILVLREIFSKYLSNQPTSLHLHCHYPDQFLTDLPTSFWLPFSLLSTKHPQESFQCGNLIISHPSLKIFNGFFPLLL